MQKILKITAVLALAFSALWAENIDVSSYNGERKEITVSVPKNPKRVVVADMSVLDTMDYLGLGDLVVAMPKAQKIEYLSKFADDKKIVNLGTMKEIDMEKLIAAKPDIIFISGRLASKFNEFSKIAPTVQLNIDYSKGGIASTEKNIKQVAKIFGKDSAVDEILNSYNARLAKINEKARGKTAIIGLVTSSSLHTLGNDKRCALITTSAGFENLAKDAKTEHGSESSFELLVKLDPEYVFILDRDSAIGKAGAKIAQDVMNNELVNKTRAAKSGKIFYLNPAAWYLSEGGITATDIMLKDIEKALEIK